MGEQAAEKLLWQTSTSLTYTFGGTGEDHAGCSKRPDFSLAHPWRAAPRLVPNKVASESNPEEVPTSLRGGTLRTSMSRERS